MIIMRSKHIVLAALLLWANLNFSQTYQFDFSDTISVFEMGSELENPWVGGINSAQISTIELNGDGLADLFIFDRTDDAIMTYINNGSSGVPSYTHAPEYESIFPSDLKSWCILRDYNCDGKKDIWTYATGGIRVFKNTGTPGNVSFSLETELVKSFYNTSHLNLYVSSTDIPSVDDIDNDGDLDVITFSIFGSNLEYHKNLSVENYGTCDSLVFRLKNNCWGHFSEAFTNSVLQLYDTCDNSNLGGVAEYIQSNSDPLKTEIREKSALRHSGSTVMTIDENGDGVKDVLIGDVSYSFMSLLTNGGSAPNTNSSMIEQDTTFPTYDTPINIKVFPASFYEDVTNDGNRDLIISPNTPNQSEDIQSVHYYLNVGTDANPSFSFQSKNLFQDNMIDVGSGSIPTFFDHNADGLMDLLVSNFGRFDPISDTYIPFISLYENTGSASAPVYTLTDNDYMNLSTSGIEKNMIPTFADLDNDGDDDMIIGDYNGVLHYFTNTAGPGNTANFVLTAPQMTDLDGITIDVGLHAAPTLFDLDKDGDFDLIIGERNGNLNYYENKDTLLPKFTYVTDSLGFIQVNYFGTSIGMSFPRFFLNDMGETQLFTGGEHGNIEHYNTIDGNLSGNFNLVTNQVSNVNVGLRSTPALQDLNNDNNLDMIVGNKRGGLRVALGTGLSNTIEPAYEEFRFSVFPNPAEDQFTIQLTGTMAIDFELLDLSGKIVRQESRNSNSTHQFDTSFLTSGMYLVKITSKSGTGTQPILIK